MSEPAMNEKDALASAEKIAAAFDAAGWKETHRYRVRCTHCDYSQETHSLTSARHFDGAVDSTGHGYVAEVRVVLAAPWAALAELDAAEARA